MFHIFCLKSTRTKFPSVLAFHFQFLVCPGTLCDPGRQKPEAPRASIKPNAQTQAYALYFTPFCLEPTRKKFKSVLAFYFQFFSLSEDAWRPRQTKTRGTQSLDKTICQNISICTIISTFSFRVDSKKVQVGLSFVLLVFWSVRGRLAITAYRNPRHPEPQRNHMPKHTAFALFFTPVCLEPTRKKCYCYH